MKKVVLNTYEELCLAAADVFSQQIKEKPDTVLGLATGGTPIGLYDELVRRYEAGELDFSKVRSFNLDEYYPIEKTHPQSYEYFMRKHLFDRVNIAKYSVLNGEATDPDAECTRYDAEIAAEGGIDLQLLGIGHNGHIAFIEPGSSYSMGTLLIDLAESSINANSRFFAPDEVQPVRALSMGVGEIFRCKKLVMLIVGADKKDIAAKLFEGKIHTDVPASLLLLHPDFTIFMDKAAAGE